MCEMSINDGESPAGRQVLDHLSMLTWDSAESVHFQCLLCTFASCVKSRKCRVVLPELFLPSSCYSSHRFYFGSQMVALPSAWK